MPLSDEEAADLAWLVIYAMDSYLSDRASLAPPPDPRLSPKWRILGYITGTDALFRAGRTLVAGEDVCYGYLAQLIAKPEVFVAAIRGTDGILEWIEDAQFVPRPHPVAGMVEDGFYDIYDSLTYRPIDGGAFEAARGLAATVGSGELIVLGHSLGAALATYLTFEIAHPLLLGNRAQGAFFASPRPGNAAFAKAFAARVAAYNVFNYELDVVTRIPLGPDYTDLLNCHWIGVTSAKARIGFTLAGHHHLICYIAMLAGYAAFDWKSLPLLDAINAACIKGPVKFNV